MKVEGRVRGIRLFGFMRSSSFADVSDVCSPSCHGIVPPVRRRNLWPQF